MWLAGGGCGWNIRMGVASGCGCKEVYRFPHITYPYSSCICSFLQQHLYFLFLFLVLFGIKFYVLNNLFAQYKHIRATTGVPRQHVKGCPQTNASYPAMDISFMPSRGRV